MNYLLDVGADKPSFPLIRPRRLRSTAAMRRMVAPPSLAPRNLVLPIFVNENLAAAREIKSLPRVFQHPLEAVPQIVAAANSAGLGGVMLFAIPARRDAQGSAAGDPNGVMVRAIEAAVAVAQDETVVIADTCLDEFTDHGHCGLLAPDGSVDNDATVAAYADLAVRQAEAGVHLVGLSGMMDGQVALVRQALDAAGYAGTGILAYSAKYASSFYGPFREAVDSQLNGDRKSYQMDFADARAGVRQAVLDEQAGADIVMVKPGLPYLDVLAEVRQQVRVPVAAYHVSGEYAQIEAAAAHGWIDGPAAHLESLAAFRRAGADVVVTYAAMELARLISANS